MLTFDTKIILFAFLLSVAFVTAHITLSQIIFHDVHKFCIPEVISTAKNNVRTRLTKMTRFVADLALAHNAKATS